MQLPLVVMFGLMVAVARGAELYVAPSGQDAHPGSEQKPFATLARAQQAARHYTGKEAVTITIRAGTYYLPETLVLTTADSGTLQAPVVYQAAGEVVLSGGLKLDLKWQPYRDGIMKAELKASHAGVSIASFDQLFVNGQRQPMARYPNYAAQVRPYNGYAADAFSRPRAAAWTDPVGGFIHAMHRAQWGGYHYRITGKRENGEVIYEGGWQNNRQMGMHPQYRYVENIFEELDAPGEWFHDPKAALLYYQPPAGVDLAKATVEVVRLRHLIEFDGTPQNPVRHLTFRGFSFRHAARTFMDVKEPLLRSDWTIYRGGAVLFEGAEDCALVDCEFDQVGGNAIFVNRYNRRLAIRGCDFHDIGASAVAFVGDPKAVRNPLFEYGQRQSYRDLDKTPGPQSDHYPADCVVEDCLIRKVGVVEKQATGVQISMALGIAVRHCSIYEASRAGINISEGTFGGHLIEFCDVFDTVRETGDHGSFNSWGRDRYWALQNAPPEELPQLALLDVIKPIVIRNNRWRCDHGWDVDLDDGSSNYEIYNNLFLKGGLKLREGFHRRVWNNIALNNSLHPHAWYQNSGDVVTNNIWMGAYRPAAMSSRLSKWGALVDRNLFSTSEADRVKFADQGCDAHSLVGDPMFLDPTKGDFRVRGGSPALTLGFRNFPMDRFGVQKPRLKSIARTPEIPPLKPQAQPASRSERRVPWKGALFKNLADAEYSAVGVAPDAVGVLVTEVAPDSEAARLGLRNDDFIQAINGQSAKDVDELLRLLRALPPDGKVRLEMIRNQKEAPLEWTTRGTASGSLSLPRFRYHGVVLEAAALKYRPHDDVIYPGVVRAEGRIAKPLGKFYLYYAPHDVPGGVCLAYADELKGPWREHTNNPIVSRDWRPHYTVSHVSGPDVIWNEEEQRFFLYFHGENPVTRMASSLDGVHFEYEGEVVTTRMFANLSEASYGRVFRHRLPGKDNRYIMLLMGNHNGTRRIYLAWSNNGRTWETRRTPVMEPPPGTDQVAGAVLWSWNGKHYLLAHANQSKTAFNEGFDLYVAETDAALERVTPLGKFFERSAVSATNPAVMSPCLIEEGGQLYLFFNIGARLRNKIALAISESP